MNHLLNKRLRHRWFPVPCGLFEIFKSISFNRPPLVASSVCHKMQNIVVNKFSTALVNNILENTID